MSTIEDDRKCPLTTEKHTEILDCIQCIIHRHMCNSYSCKSLIVDIRTSIRESIVSLVLLGGHNSYHAYWDDGISQMDRQMPPKVLFLLLGG